MRTKGQVIRGEVRRARDECAFAPPYLRIHLSPYRRLAFTLFEVLLALTLILMLMAALGVFYANVLRTREGGNKIAAEAIQTRAMLDRLADEIRHTVAIVPGDGKGFEGTEESITIVRSRLPEKYAFDEYTDIDTLPPAQTDIMRVAYHLYWDEDNRKDEEGITICYGVWRTEQKTFDPNPRFAIASETPEEQTDESVADIDTPKPVGELYAPEIKFLRFEYFDGLKWRDRWNVAASTGGGDGGGETSANASSGGGACVLPQAVRITMGRLREPPEEGTLDINQLREQREEREKREHHGDRFITTVYLPQADQSLLSTRKKGSIDDRDQMGEQTGGGGS